MNKDLKDASNQLAKVLMWKQSPFDAKEISDVSEKIYLHALGLTTKAKLLNGDPEAIVRALHFIEDMIDGPHYEDAAEWVCNHLSTLSCIIYPYFSVNDHAKGFLDDLKKGISQM